MTEMVIAISVLTMLAVAVIGFVVQHQIDRHAADSAAPARRTDVDSNADTDTGTVELPRPSV